jgi:putative DNA primase/helicase
LKEVFEDDEDLIEYVLRVLAYSLTGDWSEQLFFILWGSGANGKSTFIHIASRLAGDYGMALDPNVLLTRKFADKGPNEALAALAGVRFAYATETSDGARISPATIKALTGGEQIYAEHKYERGFNFIPVAKPWISTNHKPVIRDTSHAMWRRVRLIPFPHRFDHDKSLLPELLSELPGILAKVVAAGLNQRDSAIITPDAVLVATEAYERDMDEIGEFLGQTTITDAAESVGKTALHDRYKLWCEGSGEPLGLKAFGARMKTRGYRDDTNARPQTWTGFRFRTSAER